MFIDVCGFTDIARDMAPEAASRLLAEFRGVLTGVISDHGGMLDKFIGDAVLAVFGAFQGEADDAKRAIDCGIRALDAVGSWSASRQTKGDPEVRIGIGAHHVEVFVGAVGDSRMLEFTVLGDAVNVAERLERLTRTVGAVFAVSHEFSPGDTARGGPLRRVRRHAATGSGNTSIRACNKTDTGLEEDCEESPMAFASGNPSPRHEIRKGLEEGDEP